MLRVGQWPLNLGGGEIREPGSLIPEASEWGNLHSYIDTGRIIEEGSVYRVGPWPLKTATRVAQPGERIPEAADWPNLRSYIETGRIVVSDEAQLSPSLATSSSAGGEGSSSLASSSKSQKARRH